MHLCMQFVGGAELSNDVRPVHAIAQLRNEYGGGEGRLVRGDTHEEG